MTKNLTRYRIIAYIMDFVGILLVGFYRASHSPKITSEYPASAFVLYLGIALIIFGSAMVIYDIKKTANSKAKHQDELD